MTNFLYSLTKKKTSFGPPTISAAGSYTFVRAAVASSIAHKASENNGESFLAEQFQQVTHYLAEQFRQTTHYLTEHLIQKNDILFNEKNAGMQVRRYACK